MRGASVAVPAPLAFASGVALRKAFDRAKVAKLADASESDRVFDAATVPA